MSKSLPEIFCHVCMRKVHMKKGLVSYHCVNCGQRFMESEIEQAREEAKPAKPPKRDSEAE
jgi:predicted RNA-binding Zn-ribbon protein involved in translation (DUF1610 family)